MRDEALSAKIDALRAEGQVVVQALAGVEENTDELNCDRKLAHYKSGWHVVDIEKH